MPSTNSTQPMTRQQLAIYLGICTKTLSRFISQHQIKIEPRSLIKPTQVQLIIQKYQGTE